MEKHHNLDSLLSSSPLLWIGLYPVASQSERINSLLPSHLMQRVLSPLFGGEKIYHSVPTAWRLELMAPEALIIKCYYNDQSNK